MATLFGLIAVSAIMALFALGDDARGAEADAAAAEKREQDLLDRCAALIDQHRKSDAVVRLMDATGRPVAGAQVTIEQTRHDFLFGCNIYAFDGSGDESLDATYKNRFDELFNYATVGFYWKGYEPEKGKPHYAKTDKVVAWCAQRGIQCKGHPLLWGDAAGVPRWSKGQPSAEVQRQRIIDITTRYRGKITFWEVVNEPAHFPDQPSINDPYRWAREADPTAHLIVNDYHVLADGTPEFLLLLKNAMADGVPFDGIGIQAHEPRTMRFPLDQAWRILDEYAALGKALHITEFTPCSGGLKITGSHRQGNWDEAAQAEYAAKFYRVCFAHPSIMAITWWDLSDRGAWLPGGGMLRADMSPKPVYDELRRLIHTEWNTRVSGQADREGHCAFRGFHGQYRITVEAQGKQAASTMHLKKGAANEVTITLR